MVPSARPHSSISSTITSPERPQRESRTSAIGVARRTASRCAPPGPQINTGSPSGGTTTYADIPCHSQWLLSQRIPPPQLQ